MAHPVFRPSRLIGATLGLLLACSSDRVEPNPVGIASIRLTPESAVLPVGASFPLVAQAIDSLGGEVSGVDFVWSSDHPEIISVSGTGVATAQSPGAATVSAATRGQTGSILIAAVQPVSAVTVTPTPVALAVDESVQLTPLVTDAQGSPVGLAVHWSTDNEAVATVSSRGQVTALAPGTATITATAQGKTGASAVTVSTTAVPVSSVTLEPSSVALAPGGLVQLSATARDAVGNVLPGRSLTWSSSSAAIASVSADGLVIAAAAGSATITATSEGVDGTAQALVDPGSAVRSITVSPSDALVTLGTELQLIATARDGSGNPLPAHVFTWLSSDPQKARVSETGMVSGVAIGGPVTITAATEGVSATASITVIAVPAAIIVITPDPVSFVLGGVLRLRADVRDEAGNPLDNRPTSWTSSNPAVASVSGENVNGVAVTGVARGLGLGSATITVTADAASATAQVTVRTIRFAALSLGSGMACGLTPDGAAFCWGSDVGVNVFQHTPVSVPGGIPFAQITVGGAHACGLTTAGLAYCWGDNSLGQLGVGTPPSPVCNTQVCGAPTPVSGGLTFTELSAGERHTCGVASDGTVYCWGASGAGRLGAPPTQTCFNEQPCSPMPVPVESSVKFSQVSGGLVHTCAVSLDHLAYCLGDNTHGKLGRGVVGGHADTPSPVEGGIAFGSVDAGFNHTCGVAVGEVGFCWGDNGEGELGIGPQDPFKTTPTQVFGGLTFTHLSAGARASCGVASDGAGYCWGQNSQGTSGTGNFNNSFTPEPVAGGHTWASIEVNNDLTTCGLTTGQTGYCWGRNDAETGTGSTIAYIPTPTRVAGQE